MEKAKRRNLGIIMAVYLFGIFMGAIDTGIVTPARTVIQNHLMVDDKTGIWMITIYTLAYAASIPIMGKMADKYGRKYIYLMSIFLFGLGSLICGLSQDIGSFSVLLTGRVIQALGGGGIVPIATAEFGTTFPPEKRGMALGLIGGVYGVANIFGASAGSAIMDIFGKDNWQFIFYINLPITVFILVAGFIFLSNNRIQDVKKTDISGILLLTVMILSLMYGLKNIDFFDFLATVGDVNVYPFILIFIALLPIFILVERKAEDPVINLGYFTNGRILVTLIISFIVGIVMMGMIFVPQFSENSLKIASGSGGYFVIILGLFAGAGAPLSGKMIDKFGAKAVLATGFFISILGSLYLILVSANYPNTINVIVSLVLIGLGMGFTIGAPLNYMMLENTKKEESTSALATLSLIRSVGTVIGPAIMIGFLAHAGANVQTNVMDVFPKEIAVPSLPYAQEISDKMENLKKDPNMKEKLAGVEMPDLASMTKVKIDMSGNSGYKIPDELLELMKSSDVTTITKNSKIFAQKMFEQMSPKIVTQIEGGIQKGIDAINGSLSDMEKALDGIEKGYGAMAAMSASKAGNNGEMDSMLKTIESMKLAKTDMEDTLSKMNAMRAAVPGAFNKASEDYLKDIDNMSEKIEGEFQTTLNDGFKQVYLTVSISSFIALIILAFYRRKRENLQPLN